MERIKNRDLSQTLETSDHENLKVVSNSFNSMITELKSIMSALKEIRNSWLIQPCF